MVLAKLAAHTSHEIVLDALRAQDLKTKTLELWLGLECQFSQLYKAGNTVTVLAKLAAHASRAIARDARTGSRNQDPPAVCHAQLTIHAKFHSCIRQETR